MNRPAATNEQGVRREGVATAERRAVSAVLTVPVALVKILDLQVPILGIIGCALISEMPPGDSRLRRLSPDPPVRVSDGGIAVFVLWVDARA